MFRISRFHDVLKALPRGVFDRLVAEHGADKHSKRFGSWDHLVAMVYAQLAGVSSLRALETSFNSHPHQHYHLGTGPIRRSTLADANERRNTEVFAQVAHYLMAGVCRQLRRDGKELLYLLDSTTITLKGPGFDEWTLSNRTRSQGLKVHVLYAEQAAAPVHCSFSAANVNDIDEGRTLGIEPQATSVFDKGYYDFNWWASLDAQKARFVTRFKSNVRLKVLAQREVPQQDRETILRDEEVSFSNRNPGGRRRNHYTQPLRRILVNRPGDEPPLSLATNDLSSPAAEIAERYRDRWRIELFFKWIKQHLKVRRFLGRSENAVRIQILCALISYLLLSLYQRRTGTQQSLWMLMVEVQATLFQRPGLEAERYRRRQERMREINLRQGQLLIA